ncbi:hypothetical protein GKJPGBOP_01569 [Streptomyces paromomycinus]|uniref:Uncharacterized protein n=1 Tax=Streptomyces paromomycinus TaxID=92743 RepID=A0A401VY05_STREY|nr:hypothetical protein GKJPGBOP_01569 [Streptomyces paromomycinus]
MVLAGAGTGARAVAGAEAGWAGAGEDEGAGMVGMTRTSALIGGMAVQPTATRTAQARSASSAMRMIFSFPL